MAKYIKTQVSDPNMVNSRGGLAHPKGPSLVFNHTILYYTIRAAVLLLFSFEKSTVLLKHYQTVVHYVDLPYVNMHIEASRKTS